MNAEELRKQFVKENGSILISSYSNWLESKLFQKSHVKIEWRGKVAYCNGERIGFIEEINSLWMGYCIAIAEWCAGGAYFDIKFGHRKQAKQAVEITFQSFINKIV